MSDEFNVIIKPNAPARIDDFEIIVSKEDFSFPCRKFIDNFSKKMADCGDYHGAFSIEDLKKGINIKSKCYPLSFKETLNHLQ